MGHHQSIVIGQNTDLWFDLGLLLVFLAVQYLAIWGSDQLWNKDNDVCLKGYLLWLNEQEFANNLQPEDQYTNVGY